MRRVHRMLAVVVAGLCCSQAAADEPLPQPPAAATSDAAKSESPSTDAAKADGVNVEAPKADEVKPDAVKVEAPRGERSKPTTLDNGQVILNFRDEDWLPALDWLAKQLKLNLDFRALPEGKLSLFSSNHIRWKKLKT